MVDVAFDAELLLWCVSMLIARPFDPADVAELIAAPALHSPAALAPLDDHLALHALPVSEILLEEFDLVFVALSFVHWEHAFPAKHAFACLAFY